MPVGSDKIEIATTGDVLLSSSGTRGALLPAMPDALATMTSTFTSLVRKGTGLLSRALPSSDAQKAFPAAPEGKLFAKVDPAEDGEDCLHDCDSCTIHYPAKFSIDETADLYGHVKGWSTHLLVATGKTDWVRDVADEKGSVMQAIDHSGVEPANGRLMLSASNIPLPDRDHGPYEQPTRVLLLPAFLWIDNVTPKTVPQLITHIINAAPTNTTPLSRPSAAHLDSALSPPALPTNGTTNGTTASHSDSDLVSPSRSAEEAASAAASLTIPASLPFATTRCQHSALILLCSQKTRDARCGQSAPLLRREFERHLQPLGLYRDLHDDRPGGVGIYFISHTGGHKFSANVMVYRRAGIAERLLQQQTQQHGSVGNGSGGANGQRRLEDGGGGGEGKGEGEEKEEDDGGAAQCIWLARVRPEDCEGIIRYTVLKGKVVKPERQLRGGFDREKGLCSW